MHFLFCRSWTVWSGFVNGIQRQMQYSQPSNIKADFLERFHRRWLMVNRRIATEEKKRKKKKLLLWVHSLTHYTGKRFSPHLLPNWHSVTVFAVELLVLSAAVAMQTDAMYPDAQDAFFSSEWNNFTQETIRLTLSEAFYTNQLPREHVNTNSCDTSTPTMCTCTRLRSSRLPPPAPPSLLAVIWCPFQFWNSCIDKKSGECYILFYFSFF